MADIIADRDHPSALDRTAKLVHVSMLEVGREIFQVRGGYIACLPEGRALAGLFATEAEARAAQVAALAA